VQTIWKGAISFGLVTIPVRLYSATQERDVSFHQVHEKDGSRVRYRRVCEKEGKEIPYSEIAKGYELPDGGIVVLTKDDFAQLPLPSSKTIEVVKFVPAEEIDPIYFARAYYLKADGPGEKPYVLLRDALEAADQVALVKVALRNREALATLRSKDEILMLQTMMWPDEIRDTSSLAPSEDISVRPQEIEMAQSYIETLSGEFDPDEYSDSYREALEELIQAKVAGQELVPAEEEPETGQVIDLMSALRASVEQAKQNRGEAASAGGGGGTGKSAGTGRTAKKAASAGSPAKRSAKNTASKASGDEEAPAKKATAKKAASKTAAKKTAAKAPAKKAAAKKSSRKTA
jgi:DNA end-binding protein Ku